LVVLTARLAMRLSNSNLLMILGFRSIRTETRLPMSARAHSVILALHLMATRNQMQASLKWSRAFILVSMSMIVTAQNVISMLVLYHEHNGFAKIKFLGLFK
jgi:hypothetical protein